MVDVYVYFALFSVFCMRFRFEKMSLELILHASGCSMCYLNVDSFI